MEADQILVNEKKIDLFSNLVSALFPKVYSVENCIFRRETQVSSRDSPE